MTFDYLDTPEARRWAMRVRTRLLSQRSAEFAPEEAEAMRAVERARRKLAVALAEGLVCRDTPDRP